MAVARAQGGASAELNRPAKWPFCTPSWSRGHLGEIAAKDSRYLFLPIVSRIDRHQGGSPLPARLELDAIDTEFGHTSLGSVARQAFALAPTKGRERDAFMLALMTAGWGRGTRVRIGPELIAVAADQLRLLYEQPIRALAGVRRDAPAHPAAARLVAMAEEVTTRDRPLWLETLFITENWRVGPQWFEHAFEVEAGTARDILLKRS